MTAPLPETYFLLSMERTRQPGNRVCMWWRTDGIGYTDKIGEAWRVPRAEALHLHDPPRHLAIPCSAVDVPASRATALAKLALTKQDPPR